MEEAGLRLHGLEHVATCWSSPGVSAERIALYLACYSGEDRVEEGGGAKDEDERVTVREVLLSDLERQLVGAEVPVDMKTLLLVHALKLRRPELFLSPHSIELSSARSLLVALSDTNLAHSRI